MTDFDPTLPEGQAPSAAARDPGTDVDDPLIGTVVADRYRVLGLLGTGGMGAVYRGEHVSLRSPVAIKVLHPELVVVPEIVARFEREAIAAARIDDPHVVAATDFGRLSDGSFYLVLEYIQGRSLADVLDAGPLPVARALRIADQIVQALVAAHAAGVVHRDLKPENILLVDRPDQPDFVKVLDFGIAKVTFEDRPSLNPSGQVLTQLGSVFGTPQYMSPEQASGGVVDARSDLYTVGIILYEMLTGRPPFDFGEIGDVLTAHIQVSPPPLPSSIPAPVAALVLQQLGKDREARSQSAAALRASLADLCGPGRTASDPSLCDTHPAGALPGPAAPARPVLRWLLLVAAIVVLGIGVGLARTHGQSTAPPAASPGSSAPAVRTAVLDVVLLARAATGDAQAIEAIEQVPAAQRTAGEWVALGRGSMQLGRFKIALEAYSRAIDLDAKLAGDRTLLGHVRKAANYDETTEEALRLAALRLGSDGADLLYNVWVSTKAKTGTTQLARQLVYGRDVRAVASPALGVALDLREAETCEQIRQLLPRATLHGDTRSHRVLKPLATPKGCGPGEREDCYPCLRRGTALADAIAASRDRPEPGFVVR